MWTKLACALLLLASAGADVSEKLAPEVDAAVPPQGIPGFDGKLPTPQELLELLDSMTGISDEEKATLKEELLKSVRTGGISPPAGSDFTMQTLILFSLVGLVSLIFVFFVYKLFRCLSERQTKREEKKKNKQLKKKK